jgi:hypothetical protein
MTTETEDVRIPAPPPAAPQRMLAVGRYGPSHVDAEEFSRRVGNWGGASQRIGDRWEALVAGVLAGRGRWTLPAGGGRTLTVVAALGLDADPEAGPALQRAGVSAPDLLLVATLGQGSGRLLRAVLRAADCKVSLDTADPGQTAPARLQATFARVAEDFPAVAEALRRQVAALPGGESAEGARATAVGAVESALAGRWDAVIAGEGLFIAPDNGFNRWFVSLLENHRRTGAPLGRLPASGPRRPLMSPYLLAHLEPVPAETFLGPLAGWPEAAVVAELDGVDLARVDLVVAERCWRVGVGLRGALLALRRPLFRPSLQDTGPGGRPREAAAGLRELARRRRLRDSEALVAAVALTLDTRRPLWEREGAILRTPLGYPAWTARLHEHRLAGEAEGAASDGGPAGAGDGGAGAGAGEPLGEAPAGGERASGRALYREMGQRHRRRVLTAAAELAQGVTDEVALLEALEGRQAHWREAALQDAAELAGRLLAGTAPSEGPAERPGEHPGERSEAPAAEELSGGW